MGKFLRSVILLVLIAAVMFILNSAALMYLYGIDLSEQLDALTSLAFAGSFPVQEADVSGVGAGRKDKGVYPQNGSGGTISAGDMYAASTGGEAAGANGRNGINGENGAAGESGTAGDEYYMTLAEIASLEKMSVQDKLKAVSILSGASGDVINSAIRMAGDGITYEEYKQLMNSAKEFLDASDIEILKDILNRNRSLYAQGGE